MVTILAGAFGFFGAFAAQDLAAQALHERPLRPGAGTCPNCGARRGWRAIRCPECGRRVRREPFLAVLAALAAIGFANTAETIGSSWTVLPYLGFLLLTLALGVTDLDSLRIVDRLNIRGTALVAALLALAAAVDGDLANLGRGVLAAAAYFAGTNLVFIAVRGRGFGYGDVKLSVQLGLFCGYISWGTLGWSVMLTALIGGIFSLGVLGAALVAMRRSNRGRGGSEPSSMRESMRKELPYGPAMILGSWLAIVLAGLGAFPIAT